MNPLLARNRIALGLVVCNLILIGVVTLEMRFPATVGNMNLQPSAAVTPETHLSATLDVGLMPLDRYTEIIQRPLFSQTRRPPVEEEAAAAEGESSAQPAKPAQPPPFVLTGVIIAPDKREALLREAKGKKVSRIQQGAQIRGWQLEVVSPEAVVLRRAGDTQELKLLRKSGAPGENATQRR